ncbi:MAG: hypothetical protein JNK77_04215 [Saprospiraceae bacterium]|nr:hypothetical protein [Saprospiraceae bacterium]
MKPTIWISLFLCCSILRPGLAQQKPPENDKEFEEAYAWRIRQEFLNDVYIPKDLTEAFIQFNKLIEKPAIEKFKNMAEPDAARKLHFSFGRWIIHNWGFYGGSRFSHFLKGLGIHHPDDMAQFVIVSYHRNLNRKPLDVKAQITHYQEKRAKENEEKLKKGKVIHQETRKKKG